MSKVLVDRKVLDQVKTALERGAIRFEAPSFYTQAIEALRAALEQPEPFQPDWDRIETLQEALREHMAEIHRLRAVLEQPEQEWLTGCPSCGMNSGCDCETLESCKDVPETDCGNTEPLAWMCADEDLVQKGYSRFSRTKDGAWSIPVYTHPPRREWRWLTEEEAKYMAYEVDANNGSVIEFARAIEAALKEKNHE